MEQAGCICVQAMERRRSSTPDQPSPSRQGATTSRSATYRASHQAPGRLRTGRRGRPFPEPGDLHNGQWAPFDFRWDCPCVPSPDRISSRRAGGRTRIGFGGIPGDMPRATKPAPAKAAPSRESTRSPTLARSSYRCFQRTSGTARLRVKDLSGCVPKGSEDRRFAFRNADLTGNPPSYSSSRSSAAPTARPMATATATARAPEPPPSGLAEGTASTRLVTID